MFMIEEQITFIYNYR